MLTRVIHKLRSRGVVFLHDLLMIPLAWLGAYWLRFNLDVIPAGYFEAALQALPVVVVVQALMFRYFGLYRGLWRFASMADLMRLAQAALAGTAAVALGLLLLQQAGGTPRSVYVLYPLLLVVLLGGPRFVYRWFKDRLAGGASGGVPALIVGTGEAGEQLARELIRDGNQRYRPVAFVDDNPDMRGREIHGIAVGGTVKELPSLTRATGAGIVLIAIPSASGRQMQRISRYAMQTGLPVRTLPAVADVMAGRVTVDHLRAVAIEDIIGREEVDLDWQAMSRWFGERRVMITGGGGSIGSELCRQIAGLRPARLIVVERSEFNLYRIEQELAQRLPELPVLACLGDVADAQRMEQLVVREQPEVIFHAAAYKHVPMLEHNAVEAIRNNVLGTMTLARVAIAHGVRRFVLVSTDKAVNPANVMGASKRFAELYCQSRQEAATDFVTVRFGNVLDSDGSVLPRFREQIEAGGPVTVTHPEITRYFMTIPEACQLIMQSAVMGEGGEIFVLEMGEPLRIQDLARQMIRISGKDVDIVYTGLRPGEKLYEELFLDAEQLRPTAHTKIRLARRQRVDAEALEQALERLRAACDAGDEARLRELIGALLPEYRPGTQREPGTGTDMRHG